MPFFIEVFYVPFISCLCGYVCVLVVEMFCCFYLPMVLYCLLERLVWTPWHPLKKNQFLCD